MNSGVCNATLRLIYCSSWRPDKIATNVCSKIKFKLTDKVILEASLKWDLRQPQWSAHCCRVIELLQFSSTQHIQMHQESTAKLICQPDLFSSFNFKSALDHPKANNVQNFGDRVRLCKDNASPMATHYLRLLGVMRWQLTVAYKVVMRTSMNGAEG